MYLHNNWANKTIIETCSALTDEQLGADPVTGTYGTIADTIHHLVRAQGRYAWRLTGDESFTSWAPDEIPGLDVLAKQVDTSGEALIKLAKGADSLKPFQTEFDGDRYSVDPSVILIQVINHATEHRAHIMTAMTTLGIEPPELDGWNYGDYSGLMTKTT
jgi:uncharacterized damage-inducible protein DinB